MNKNIINSKLAFAIKDLYQTGVDKHEKLIIDSAMNTSNFSKPINNISPKSINKIAFIIQGIAKYSGGITSVLRLGTYLYELGYEISYLDFSHQRKGEIEENAYFNLKDYKGKIGDYFSVAKDGYDVIIATSWESFYKMGKFQAYKMYFVQDYEPYFSKFNEKFLLAKKTYELGAHIVSLGIWNIKQIKRECRTDSILDSISFPYEPKEYQLEKKRNFISYSSKKKIKIAVYTKEEGKRIPNIIQAILKRAKNELMDYGIELEIFFFGLKKNYLPSIGKNLGKLTKNELLNLYKECDFGMCASMTNISLVPYEMIATGLPLIEFENGSFPEFFSHEAAILIDYNFQTLVVKLLTALRNPIQIEHMVEIGQNSINGLSWKKTVQEFNDILKYVCKG